MDSIIQQLNIWLIPVLFAITLHEAAHGLMASLLGDKTAQMLGRISLNPIKHIDPIGTILVPLGAFLLGGFVFGWAKPVPITIQNFSNPKRDMMWVALAGPLANLLMALFWMILFKIVITLSIDPSFIKLIANMSIAGIQINIILMVLNLLPIPPLDGSKVLSGLLPNNLAWQLQRIEPYGFIIIVGLLATGLLGKIIAPIIRLVLQFLNILIGIT